MPSIFRTRDLREDFVPGQNPNLSPWFEKQREGRSGLARNPGQFRMPVTEYSLKKAPVVRRCMNCGFETLPGTMEETGEAWSKHLKPCRRALKRRERAAS